MQTKKVKISTSIIPFCNFCKLYEQHWWILAEMAKLCFGHPELKHPSGIDVVLFMFNKL
jgi:hypothetical protein